MKLDKLKDLNGEELINCIVIRKDESTLLMVFKSVVAEISNVYSLSTLYKGWNADEGSIRRVIAFLHTYFKDGVVDSEEKIGKLIYDGLIYEWEIPYG